MEENRGINQKNRDSWITIGFTAFLIYVTYSFAKDQVVLGGMNDYAAHTTNILSLFRSDEWWKGFMAVPHCMWHLTVLFFYEILQFPMEAAAGYATALYTAFYYLVLIWAIRKVTAYVGEMEGTVRANVLATGFCLLQALYVYWMDAGERYLGTFSMNPLHNPTQMSVRGFAILCFCLTVDILGDWSKEGYQPIFFEIKGKKYYVTLMVLLLVSTIMKPTFTEVFVPAVAFYMLAVWIRKCITKKGDAGAYFAHCLLMLLLALPSLLFVAIQFLLFFALGGSYGNDGGLIITDFMEVWGLFSDNVFFSVLLGMAFPIYMLLIDGTYFLKSRMGQIAWLSYFIGFLEAAFLGEAGNRITHANFIWPMMSGMLLVWLVSLFRLLSLERTRQDTVQQRILVIIGWCIFTAHVVCGLIFLKLSLMGL